MYKFGNTAAVSGKSPMWRLNIGRGIDGRGIDVAWGWLTHRKKIMPALGPRSDLCVVVVTMSQYSKGWAASCAATKPLHRSRHTGRVKVMT